MKRHCSVLKVPKTEMSNGKKCLGGHGSQWFHIYRINDFFVRFNDAIFTYFSKYKTIETHARPFLPLNISAVGSMYGVTNTSSCF